MVKTYKFCRYLCCGKFEDGEEAVDVAWPAQQSDSDSQVSENEATRKVSLAQYDSKSSQSPPTNQTDNQQLLSRKNTTEFIHVN